MQFSSIFGKSREMGGQISKEEVVIAQSAGQTADGQNSATTQQSQQHVTTNILLTIMCTVLLMGILVVAYKLAKKCHDKQIQRRLNEAQLERYASILRQHQLKPESVV
jgi:hypothetical protein